MSKRYKILLIEDNEIDRMAFERFIQRENLPYDYSIAESAAQARSLLASETFDVALIDHSLGDGTGLELFDAAQDMPIIMITGSSNLEIAVEVMKAGAFDFIAKDREGNYLTTLPITVKNTIERWQAQQELVHYRTRLEALVEERTAAWKEERVRLQTVVESIPIIVFSLSHDAIFNFIVGNTLQSLGYGPNDLIGQSLFSFFPDQPEILSGFEKALSGETFTMDVEVNGHWFYISLSAKRGKENLSDIIGILHDITDRKLAEIAVGQERNLLRTLIDNIPDYIFVKDQDGRFVETNIAHAAGANLSRQDMIHRTAAEVFDPSLAAQFHEDDNVVLTNGKAIINQERITTDADGERRWVLTTKVPIFDGSKNTIGLVGISRDITDRRNAEEHRLETERLRIEIQHERELVELKQQFIEMASHNFRTPLTIIHTIAHLLETYHERISSNKQMEKLQQIQKQVDHMIAILNDVLTLSKTNAGKVNLSLTEFDIRSFCEHIWEDMTAIDLTNHELDFQYHVTTQEITADENLLQQILVNLISNAFKYTPPGRKIQFQVNQDEQSLIFSVIDQGFGIPEPDQKHLFEPFHRGTNVRTIEGTGLGLVIAKNYAELQGGTIHVESKENIGTTFTVRIPLSHNDL